MIENKERREAERVTFLAYVYAECLVPGATTNVEWEDEEPYYYVLDSGARFDLIGEWEAWQARALLAPPSQAGEGRTRADAERLARLVLESREGRVDESAVPGLAEILLAFATPPASDGRGGESVAWAGGDEDPVLWPLKSPDEDPS